MAKKFYAVRQGRQYGIFHTWSDCQKQVTGYKGAIFKGFDKLEEAENFLKGSEEASFPAFRDGAAVAYVDGSYNVKTNVFSFGAVIFANDKETHLKQAFEDKEMALMRNVAGEIKGSMSAMQYCIDNEIDKLDIFYDYTGIEYWCTGAWKTNKKGTAEYKAYYDSIKDKLDVRFIKVKGHSGDTYNDMADKLAKEASGIE